MTQHPLKGIRVVEQGTFITGPAAGMFLADLGADVIKVERPETGDPFRAFKGGLYSPHFQAYNRNKRSIALDNRIGQKDREIFEKLIQSADVYIENFRPESAQRMGLDAATLHTVNPRLIHCSISGFGPDGPYEDRPSYDTVTQAISGYLHLLLNPGNPRVIGPAIADAVTGFYAAYGVLGALLKRVLNPEDNMTVEVSMLEAMSHFNIDSFTHYFAANEIMGPYSRPTASQSYVVQCQDGQWLALHMSSPEKFWQGLALTIEQPTLFEDPRLADRNARLENYEAIADLLKEEFKRKPRAEWCRALEKHDVPHATVNTAKDALDDPQFKHLGIEISAEHPTMGLFKTIRSPITYNQQRPLSVMAPPVLDEHRDEILKDLKNTDY